MDLGIRVGNFKDKTESFEKSEINFNDYNEKYYEPEELTGHLIAHTWPVHNMELVYTLYSNTQYTLDGNAIFNKKERL